MFQVLLLALFSSALWAQIIPNDVDLFALRDKEIKGKSRSQIHDRNLDVIENLMNYNPESAPGALERDKKNAKFLSPLVRKDILNVASDNPVIGSLSPKEYDPTGAIGFCFGRAMFMHLELTLRGFDRDSIKKVIVLGRLASGGWGWHIATLAQSRTRNGKRAWMVLDPIHPGAWTIQEWYMIWSETTTFGGLVLFTTEAGRLGPSPSDYSYEAISDPFYNDFFVDMLKWFEDAVESQEPRYWTMMKEYGQGPLIN